MRWAVLTVLLFLALVAGVVVLGWRGLPTTQALEVGQCTSAVPGYRIRPFLRDWLACGDDCRLVEVLAAYDAKRKVLACLCRAGDRAAAVAFYRDHLVASFVGEPIIPKADTLCAGGANVLP